MKYQKYTAVSALASALIVLSACAVTQHLPGESEAQWRRVSGGETVGGAIFIDEKSIQHVSATVVRLRVRYRYFRPKPFDSGAIEELQVYNEYDCNNRDTYRILSSEAHFTDGKSSADSSERQGYLLPGDAVFRYVCK